MKICSAEGCVSKARSRGLCEKHYVRMKRHGHLNETRRQKGAGSIDNHGYTFIVKNGVGKRLHVMIAEGALGKTLPKGAEVHHLDGNPKNNNPRNLVICPDAAYHILLHVRQRALEECGNANYRKCTYCKRYDDPGVMHIPTISRRSSYHQECMLKFYREKRAKKKQEKLGGSK